MFENSELAFLMQRYAPLADFYTISIMWGVAVVFTMVVSIIRKSSRPLISVLMGILPLFNVMSGEPLALTLLTVIIYGVFLKLAWKVFA